MRTSGHSCSKADVKCLTYLLNSPKHIKLCLTWYWTSIIVMINWHQSYNVSADQCRMTASRAQVSNSLRWPIFKSSVLTSYGIQLIAGSENFYLERHFLRVPKRALHLALAKPEYQAFSFEALNPDTLVSVWRHCQSHETDDYGEVLTAYLRREPLKANFASWRCSERKCCRILDFHHAN